MWNIKSRAAGKPCGHDLGDSPVANGRCAVCGVYSALTMRDIHRGLFANQDAADHGIAAVAGEGENMVPVGF